MCRASYVRGPLPLSPHGAVVPSRDMELANRRSREFGTVTVQSRRRESRYRPSVESWFTVGAWSCSGGVAA